MDIVAELNNAGFGRVIVLDGAECGYPEVDSILLALWPYEAEATPAAEEAWIHPYYFASQQAYRAADDIAKVHAADGVAWREDIRLKPIFARLDGFSQGRNTLSYTEEYGSRFHVQILTMKPGIAATHHLSNDVHPLHCGTCHLCEGACPTNALEGGVFHRERCLRNWQISGQVYPDNVREKMGNRLIGCDDCQRCCPHNHQTAGEAHIPFPLEDILTNPKEAAKVMRDHIGATITMFNRVLGGACIIAGCLERIDLLPYLESLAEHPSAAVAEHAQWSIDRIKMKHM